MQPLPKGLADKLDTAINNIVWCEMPDIGVINVLYEKIPNFLMGTIQLR